MLGLPEGTRFEQKIPKQKFYNLPAITSEIRRFFIDYVKGIQWAHKLSPSTMTIGHGERVDEIEVIHITLSQLPQTEVMLRDILQWIDRHIFYHVLFVVTCESKEQMWASYKDTKLANSTGAENSRGRQANAVKIHRYYHNSWETMGTRNLLIEGFTMDEVYDSFLRQIAEGKLDAAEEGESIEISVERNAKRQQLEKKIQALTNKMRREKQFNRQVEIKHQIKKLRGELERLTT